MARVTAPEERVELNPPPLGCEGGCSRVVPRAVMLLAEPHGGRSTVTSTSVEVRGRRSAVPDGAGKVVRLEMLKRRRVSGAPVLLMKVRRRSMVPEVELFGGSEPSGRCPPKPGGRRRTAAASFGLAGQ